MTYGNDRKIYKKLKNCLIQLNSYFQWLAVIENKTIEKDGVKMGSNFAKFKIYPEYNGFINYACEAEKHFSEVSDKNYHSVGTDCRMSLEGFMTYLYENKKLKIDEKYFKHTEKDETLWSESNRVKSKGNETNPTGYELGTKLDQYGNPRKLFWLDAAITSTDFQDFFKKHNARPSTKEKQDAAKFSHYKKDKSFYSGEKALAILTMIYNLYLHCDDKQLFAGTPRFDVSLLKNTPKELITPQLTIEINGKEIKIPQNKLLEAVYSKKVTEHLIKENLSLINKTDVLGNTPLSFAIYNDDYATVKMLLENGADPNFYFKNLDFMNHTGDFYESVTEEITKDTDKYKCVWSDYIEAHRCIPLIIALKKDNADIMNLLLQYHAKTWDSCIDDWYNIAKISPECSTLLACAFYYNADECIRLLLKKDDIDINQKTISGVTPLMLAVENGSIYYNKLLANGAKLDILDKSKNSVFLHAVQNMRHELALLDALLERAKADLPKDKMVKLLNHSGNAGCPLSYMNEKEAKLYLEYGADINAKNKNGVSCIVDVEHLNPKLLSWFKENGAKLDFKTLFSINEFLKPKYSVNNIFQYNRSSFSKLLDSLNDFISPDDLNFSVAIDNIPRISPLVDAILLKNAKNIQYAIARAEEKINKKFLTNSQIYELKNAYPFINQCSKYGMTFSSYQSIERWYNTIIEGVKEGWPHSNLQKNLIIEEIKKLPKEKLDITIDMSLEEVFQAIASVKELSKEQKNCLFRKHPFIKKLEMKGIDYNVPEEVETEYNGKDWEMSPSEIIAAVREIKSEITYEDVKISPLDDALISKNYEVASFYLSKGISVSELSKILLLSVYNASEELHKTLEKRKDIDFSDVLITLCKNHPKEDFDITEEFINNGYNFYRFAKYNLLPDFTDILNCDYKSNMLFIKNKNGSFNKSPSLEDIHKRNNNSFLNKFNETSFQDVNLKLINTAIISFDADSSLKDKAGKSAIDYAKENGIYEFLLKAAIKKKQQAKVKESAQIKAVLHNGVIANLRHDKTDITKIYDGRIESNGKLYNFKKLFDKNNQKAKYDPSYKERTVTFKISKVDDGTNPGFADNVTLTDD